MTAPQTTWARPLGNKLVSLFREDAFWYIEGPHTAYDPYTGAAATTFGRIWHCGAAVVRKGIGRHTEWGNGIPDFLYVDSTDVQVWLDSTTLPIEPSNTALVWYQGQEWHITKVEPALESGTDFYAYSVVITAIAGALALSNNPPPPGKYPGATIESLLWLPGGSAPGQPLPGGGTQVLKWQPVPMAPVAMAAGTAGTATQGAVTGGIGPYTYANQWFSSVDAMVWAPITGATNLNITPTAAQVGQYLHLQATATDSSTPPQTVQAVTLSVQVTVAPLVAGVLPTVDPTTAAAKVGTQLLGIPGTATGGTGAITYASKWQASADGVTAWADLPADPGNPLAVTPGVAQQGQFLRFTTTATDSGTPAQVLEMHSHNTATVAGPAVTPLAQVTAPTITGLPVVGQVLTAAGAAATGGVGAVAIAYRWQVAKLRHGPWTDVVGAAGATYTPTAADVGLHLRAVAQATDSAVPPHVLDMPSTNMVAVSAALVNTAAPVLPAAAPRVGVAFGPITDGTWTGGAGTVTLTQQWQLSKDGTTGWAAIAGANGSSYTPLPAEAGQFLRVVQTATDSAVPPVAVAANSAASLAVFSATTLCAGGAVVVRGAVYCDKTPGTWTKSTGTYNPLTGALTTGGWTLVSRPLLSLPQLLDPQTQLTYGTPVGVAADWREGPEHGVWHNLRSGEWWSYDAYKWGGGNEQSYGGYSTAKVPTAYGVALQPWVCGPIVAPSVGAALTVIHPPTPATGTWKQLPPLVAGGVPRWEQTTPATGLTVTQWGDPTVIGLPGATSVLWLGTGPDPWEQATSGTNQWSCTATGQVWPTPTTFGLPNTRPQPADTATIPRPVNTVPTLAGTAGYDPWVQLPRVSPVSWWNYVTRQEVHKPTEPPFSPWADMGAPVAGMTRWVRQPDGLGLVQRVDPSLPIDTPADWWADPAGTWHSTLRSEIYVQAGNPGTGGNVVLVTAAVPAGGPSDWVRSGTGAVGAPYRWARATTHQTVTQPGNPGIAGIVGPVEVAMAANVAPAAGGNLQVGQVLTLTGGTVTGGTGAVTAAEQWERQATAGGAWVGVGTGTTYTLVTADVGAMLRVEVTHTDSATPTAHTFVHSSPAVGPVTAAPLPLAQGTVPAISAPAVIGNTLTATAGTSTGGTGTVTHVETIERQAAGSTTWVAVGTPYTVLAADAGASFRASETVTDSATPAPHKLTMVGATVGPVVAPLVAGTATLPAGSTPAIGAALTVTAGAATGGVGAVAVSYKWETGPAGGGGPWVAVGTAASYTPAAADAGLDLHCTVTWADSAMPAHKVAVTVAAGTVPSPVAALGTGAGNIPPAAPGAPYQVAGFVWRAPGGTGAWHWDAGRKVWTNGVTSYPQQNNGAAALNPGITPTAADTGPFDLNGVFYAQTNVPPVITWAQTSPGVWQKRVNGAASGPALHQVPDPRGMPA